MRLHPTLTVLMAALPLACVRPGAVVPPPAGMRTIVVAPLEDRTGTVLGGERYLERLLGRPRTTLADVLAAEVRSALSRRGFSVAAGDAVTDEAADTATEAGVDEVTRTTTDAVTVEVAGAASEEATDTVAGAATDAAASLAADVLTFALEIRRWEPDIPALRFVLVSLDARLVGAPGARVFWSARRNDWQVPTRGAPTPEAASALAARVVAEALVGAWRPGP